MSRIAAVAVREFKQTVLRKVFLLAIIGIPVLGVAAIGLAVVVLLGHEQPPLIGTIAVIDPMGEVAAAAAVEFRPEEIEADRRKEIEQAQEAGEEAMRAAGFNAPTSPAGATRFDMGIGHGEVNVDIEAHPGADAAAIEALRDRVRRGDLLAAAVFDAQVIEPPTGDPDSRPRFNLLVGDGMDADHAGFIERRLGEAVVRVRASRAGLDPQATLAMLRRPESSTRRILPTGQEADEDEDIREIRAQVIPMAFMMLLWIGVFTSAQHLMMSTIEEKSNRVMEVLLSAVSPMQLMTGKILGHGAVGLLIVLIYSSLGLAGLGVLKAFNLIQLMDLVYLFVFFFMAYFMIAAMMAAVGSAVTDIREANTLVTPVMLLAMVPLFLWMPISQAPNGGLATAFSFIPPASPFVMILRLAADEPVPAWQIPATIAWGYACVLGMIWMAAKIFRIGVLMYGKPPTPGQLIRWLRYA